MNITDLADLLCQTTEPICESNYDCIQCDISIEARNKFTYYLNLQRSDLNIFNTNSIVSILELLFHLSTSKRCASCNDILYRNSNFLSAPDLLILHIPYADAKINTSFKFLNKSYSLRGVIYYGSNHYTSCIVSENKNVWYHDRIQTGKNMIFEGALLFKKSKDWNVYNNKKVVLFKRL